MKLGFIFGIEKEKGGTHMTLNSFMPVKLVTGAGCVRESAKELAKHFSFEHIRGDSIYLDGNSLF